MPYPTLAQTRVGIIGLGNVGRLVANNICRTNICKLQSVFDLNASTADGLPAEVERAKSAGQLAEQCDLIITALPTPTEVLECVEQDILPAVRPNSIWIDHSTTDYEQTIDLARRMKEQAKSETLEAPVTGGITLLRQVVNRRQGKMTTLVGGERWVFDHVSPLMAASCANLLYMGPIGSATVTKVISNLLAGAHQVLTGEALMLAKRADVDLRAFFDGIRLSAGNSYVFETEAPLVFKGTYEPDFTLKLHCKDFALGNRLAQKFNSPTPVYSLVEQIYNMTRVRYGDSAGSSHPPKLLEEALGEKLQIDGFEDWSYSIQQVEAGSIGVVQKNIAPIGGHKSK